MNLGRQDSVCPSEGGWFGGLGEKVKELRSTDW